MADYGRAAWQSVEVLSTGDVSAARAAHVSVEVLTTGDVNLARSSWVSAEVLSTGTESWARSSWKGIEVLLTFSEVSGEQFIQGGVGAKTQATHGILTRHALVQGKLRKITLRRK